MRFLHTSDWHLGRTLHGVDLIEAQRAVLQQIVQLVTQPADGIPIDAVLVSGDIYDRAVPPVEAVTLLAEVLAELIRHTAVVITGGNHDSAIRLGFGSALFTDRLQVRTSLATVGEPILLRDTAVYALPYLDPDIARNAFSTDGEPLARSHQAVMATAMDAVRLDLRSRPTGTRAVVMAHAFVMGGAESDSERTIAVGGVDQVSSATFAGVDYVALGHLHRAQRISHDGATVVRYSGSLLRYSFSERQQQKSVTLVDLLPDGSVSTSLVELRQPRGMSELSGSLADLTTDPAHEPLVSDWVRVTVTDRHRPDQMFDRVKSRFPHVLQVFHIPEGSVAAGGAALPVGAERSFSARELGADFVQHVTGSAADPVELELFEQAYQECVNDQSLLNGGRV
ncbi:exonuclease SbcCD subunit D [soil metagenome]|jgi:exonuclease SbcD